MLTLSCGDVKVVIDPEAGGRLASWRVGDVELLASEGTSPVTYGMYPMAPWAGRIDDDTVTFGGSSWRMPATHDDRALHGRVLTAAMSIVSSSVDHAVLECVVSDPWPWVSVVRVIWRLHDRAVEARVEVSSGGGEFPAVVGWHPWFRRDLGVGGPLRWSFPEERGWRMAERGNAYALTGRLLEVSAADVPFDDAFLVRSRRARLEWAHALTVEVTSSHDWFVVFDERPASVCIEPQSGPPNGVNESALAPVFVVTPERSLALDTMWRITSRA